jgi:ATP-dependent DNA ligase
LDRVPLIAKAIAELKVKSVTLDGEGVVCGPDGLTDFDRLRAAVGRKGSRDAFLYAFDLLEIDGTDLRREPWDVRRETLASLLRKARDGIRLSEHPDSSDGEAVFHHACTGLIAPADPRIGSRSRTPTLRQPLGFWNFRLRGATQARHGPRPSP